MSATMTVQVEAEWLVRPYEDGDEDGFFYLLGASYCRSKAGWRAGAVRQIEDAGPNEKQQAFMRAHAPVWRWLLAHAQVTFACDAAAPSIIWAWLVTSEPNVIHAVGCKRSLIKAGIANEIVIDLLGPRWTTHQVLTLELPQFRSGMATSVSRSSNMLDLKRPHEWSLDPTWLLTRMIDH